MRIVKPLIGLTRSKNTVSFPLICAFSWISSFNALSQNTPQNSNNLDLPALIQVRNSSAIRNHDAELVSQVRREAPGVSTWDN